MAPPLPPPSPSADSSLLQSLLLHQDDDEDVYDEKPKDGDLLLALLLPWISGTPSDHRLLNEENPLACKLAEEMQQTNPSSFGRAFLDYLRSESEVFFRPLLEQESKENEILEQESKENEPHNVIKSSSHNASFSASYSSSLQGNVVTKPLFRPEDPLKDEGGLYDAEFPSLGSSSVAPLKLIQVQPQARPKRRVNPTPTQNPVVESAFILAKIEANKSTDNYSSKTRSNIPLKVDMDALMQRCDLKRKSKSKTAELTQTSIHQPSVNDRYSPMQMRNAIDSIPKSVNIPKSSILRLRRFAMIHSKLIIEKLVPSLIEELQFIFQLLSLQQSSKHQRFVSISERCLFGSGSDCSFYACALMEQLGRILDSVGEPLLSSLVNHPCLAQHSPSLQKQLKASLASHQATALHSVKLYKPCTITNVLSETNIGMPVSLPFDAARDSRNNYKSRESQALYNNRELCRDHFYAIIREAASVQNSFGCSLDVSYSKTRESVKIMMNDLLIENYPWFTELFLEQFVQVAMCGETDPVVTDLARQDPVKLQRLHDRLTLCQRKRCTSLSLPLNITNKANDLKDVKILNSSTQNLKSTVKSGKVNQAEIDFSTFFPPALRVYVWIMEAADSYRLTMHMIWSLKFKILRLTEIPQHSRDAAEIGSLLTQRVLSLKALASLLGFLSFFPGGGQRSEGFEWEISQTDPPINVVSEIEKAISNETMLLVLPWVLDFLRLVKLDRQAISLPYFQKALRTLWKVYSYPILDPKCEYFGVSSMCILASLDRFFDFMALPNYDINQKQTESSNAQKATKNEDFPLEAKINSGIDRIVGVVDTCYIQHCCPALMELRVMLMEFEKQSNSVSKSATFPGRSLRKITPVHHPKASGVIEQGISSVLEDDNSFSDNYIQMKLQQSFFEQRLELQRLVDFVVDTIAGNAARAVSLKCVPSVMGEALHKLETSLSEKLQRSVDSKKENLQQESEVEADVENIITSTIQKALIPAMEYAKNYTRERVSEALTLLASPDESPYVLKVATRIAADASGSAACKKALANIACDVRKCITQEVELWRQSLYTNKKKEQSLRDGDISRTSNENQPVDSIPMEKDDIQSACKLLNINSTTDAKIKQDNAPKSTQTCSDLDRTLSYCASVVEFCSDCLQFGSRRHKLRVNLAAACMSMETMISSGRNQFLLGGVDAIVHRNVDNECSGSFDHLNLVRLCYDLKADFRIEVGLVRRSIALALSFCLDSPLQAFGFSPESLEGCMCFQSIPDFQYVDHLEFRERAFHKFDVHEQGVNAEILIRSYCRGSVRNSPQIEKSLAKKKCIDFYRREKQIGCSLMPGLLSMWEALVRNGICEGAFLISEFLSSWRWFRLLLLQPWKNCEYWFEAVTHCVASILVELIRIYRSSSRISGGEQLSTLLGCLFKEFFVDKREQETDIIQCYIRRLVTCIFIEALHLQCQQWKFVDEINHQTEQDCEGSSEDCVLAVISLVELCSEGKIESFIDIVQRQEHVVELPIKEMKNQGRLPTLNRTI